MGWVFESHLYEDENIEVNLRSLFVFANAAYLVMKEAGGGKIISIGSMRAIFGVAALPACGTSKGGIVQLTGKCPASPALWAGSFTRGLAAA